MILILLLVNLLLICTTYSHSVIRNCWSSHQEVDVGIYLNFSYQFVFVNKNNPIELQCREWYIPILSSSNYPQKINFLPYDSSDSYDHHDVDIHWRKVHVNANQSEVTHSLNKQMKSLNKGIKILDNTSLYIKKVQPKHSGLYNCYLNSSSSEFKSSLTTPFETYSYFVHVSDDQKNKSLNGTYTEWNYYEDYVYKSGQKMLLSIPHGNQTTKLSLFAHWSPWGSCLCGKYICDTRSYRFAYCCIKLFDGLILPCQSATLKEIRPDVAKIVENVSKFKEYRRCMDDCVPAVSEVEIDFKYQKTFYLRESANRELKCTEPNNSVAGNSSEILWTRDDDELLSKPKNAQEKNEGKEVRVTVDSLNTLYLTDVTKSEEGYYSCFDNGLPIVKFFIRIEPHNLIFTKECGQKLLILSLFIVLWVVIYLIPRLGIG